MGMWFNMEFQCRLTKILESITNISEKFYRQNNSEAYKDLDNLFIEFDFLLNNKEMLLNEVIKNNVMDISLFLGNILEALKERDGVLIADILSFDISERIKNISDVIGE